MADGIAITPGSGATVAAESISSQYLQRIKLALGVVDTDNGDVLISNPMPVQITGGTTNIGAMPGVVLAGGTTGVTGTFWQTTQPVSGTVTALVSGTVSVGTVSIGNSPAVTVSSGNIVVSGTVNTTATVTSSGTTNIGNVVVVSGTVNTTGSLSGTVAVSGGTTNIGNIPNVIVSGTVNTTGLSATLSGGTVNLNSPTGGLVISGTVNASVSIGSVSITGGTVNVGNVVVISGTVNTTSSVTVSGTSNVSLNQISGNAVATSVGPTGTGVIRTVVADNTGRTLLAVAGTTNTALANNTIIPLNASYKNKIYALSLTTLQNAAPVTVTLQDGTGGNPLWQVVLQAISGSVSGANLAVTPPAYLFSNSSINTLINMNIVGGTASPIDYSLGYWQDAT